jgi:hypothetical protein
MMATSSDRTLRNSHQIKENSHEKSTWNARVSVGARRHDRFLRRCVCRHPGAEAGYDSLRAFSEAQSYNEDEEEEEEEEEVRVPDTVPTAMVEEQQVDELVR